MKRPRTVQLITGREAVWPTVEVLVLTLNGLKSDSSRALRELLKLARKPRHRLSGKAGRAAGHILYELNLLQYWTPDTGEAAIRDDVCDVVLAAVSISAFGRIRVAPTPQSIVRWSNRQS